MFLLLALACSNESTTTFAGGGTAIYGDSGTNGATDDSSGEEGEGGDPDGPTLSNMVLKFDDLPNVGMSLRADFAYQDAVDDVIGGKLYLDYTEATGDTDQLTLDIVSPADLDTTKKQAIVEEAGSAYFALTPVDNTKDYTIAIQVKDLAGFLSNTLEETLSGS